MDKIDALLERVRDWLDVHKWALVGALVGMMLVLAAITAAGS